MRKISIVLLIALSSSICLAQNKAIDNLFDKYSNKEGFTSVFISKHMFDLFKSKNAGDKNKKDLDKSISGLESIRILTVDDSLVSKRLSFYDEIMEQLNIKEYKSLMAVKEKNQDLKMLIKEKDKKIVEFLMIGGGDDNLLICITGEIDLKSISDISKSMDIEGLDNLEKMEGE